MKIVCFLSKNYIFILYEQNNFRVYIGGNY